MREVIVVIKASLFQQRCRSLDILTRTAKLSSMAIQSVVNFLSRMYEAWRTLWWYLSEQRSTSRNAL